MVWGLLRAPLAWLLFALGAHIRPQRRIEVWPLHVSLLIFVGSLRQPSARRRDG